jgi:hypothetical protein
VARTNAEHQRISRARFKLGQELPTAKQLEGERVIAEVDGVLVVYKYSDRRRAFVLEGELVPVSDALAREVDRYVQAQKHRP